MILNVIPFTFFSYSLEQLRKYKKGILCAVLIACSASFIAEYYGGPVMLYALLLGMAFHFLYEDNKCQAGIDVSAQTILKIGIALMGVRISLSQILQLGIFPLCVIGFGIASTILIGIVVAKKCGYSKYLGMLTGGAVAICGVSAAMAIASILPTTKHSKRDVLMTVAVVTSFSTIAMVVYPIIVSLVGLNESQSALFLGGTIHDVAQVIGAGYMISDGVGERSVVVKLVRIGFLTPVLLCFGLICRNDLSSSKLHMPMFLVMFFVFVILANINIIPTSVGLILQSASRWCILISISALGLKTSLKELCVVGVKPLILIGIQSIWLAMFILGAIKLVL